MDAWGDDANEGAGPWSFAEAWGGAGGWAGDPWGAAASGAWSAEAPGAWGGEAAPAPAASGGAARADAGADADEAWMPGWSSADEAGSILLGYRARPLAAGAAPARGPRRRVFLGGTEGPDGRVEDFELHLEGLAELRAGRRIFVGEAFADSSDSEGEGESGGEGEDEEQGEGEDEEQGATKGAGEGGDGGEPWGGSILEYLAPAPEAPSPGEGILEFIEAPGGRSGAAEGRSDDAESDGGEYARGGEESPDAGAWGAAFWAYPAGEDPPAEAGDGPAPGFHAYER